MNVFEADIVRSEGGWDEKVQQLQEILQILRPKLIAAEAELSDRLAAISAFEFKVRSSLERLTRRLEDLESEISFLKRKRKELQENWFFNDEKFSSDLYEEWRSSEDAGAATDGSFRYHEGSVKRPQESLSVDQKAELKNLYRRLARRFHPDFALDEEDRAYRTEIMMSINAAYTAGDIDRLLELLEQPDPLQKDYTTEDLAAALLKELHHCQRRLDEIDLELRRLNEHPSSKLMKRAEKSAAVGRDLLEELAEELRERIAYRMVQKDVLEDELESIKNGQPDMTSDDFADTVYDLGLEQVMMSESDAGIAEWRDKYHPNTNFDDENDDSVWDGLRKGRKGK